jgi:hypothetical protein
MLSLQEALSLIPAPKNKEKKTKDLTLELYSNLGQGETANEYIQWYKVMGKDKTVKEYGVLPGCAILSVGVKEDI